MANITLKKNDPLATQQQQTWDPFQTMREMMRWNPFGDAMPGFFNAPTLPELFSPAFEVKETKESYLFTADLPGIKEQNLDVSISGDRITVSGKREAEKNEQGDTWYTYERSYGSFSRSFTLPAGIDADHIRAELKDGVLTMVVPKGAEVQAKKITVKAEKAKA